MKRNYWFILLGVVLALLICCCVLSWGLAGLLWMSEATTQASPASALDTLEPTPVLDPEHRLPTPAERRSARVLAESAPPQRDLVALASRLQGVPEPRARTDPDAPPDFEVGDALTFWIHDVQTISFFTTTATLRYETPHAYWWVEEGYKVPSEDLERTAKRFEEQTYPTNRRYFGSEWIPGVDGDPHVYIFLGNVPGVGGYFSAPDEYPTEIRPRSNEHEMFYINLDNAMPGNDYFDGILAHEFQHMIHWAVDRNEDTWVNEGLSKLAAQVNGCDVGGSDYAFSLTPDTQLTTWTDLEDSAPHYGASYLFLAYFLERYGEAAVRRLVAEPANGIAGFDEVLSHAAGISGTFEDLFADWLVANYLDDSRPAAGRYGYADLRLEPVSHAAHHAGYPVREQATVHQYAADYILLEGEGDLVIEFDGNTVVSLLGNETYSGEYQWWSNRADDGDATLTRAFDLSDLEQATLQAWMWYDIEAHYDYAYVEVSTDGGQTWSILGNEHTATTDPSGNSYGPAFTGLSGGGEEPQWALESFDLTPFAGQEILIRFEVVTDEALNRPGLALDDISIPELGYSYDVEEGEGGWQAKGWVRVTDHIPQDFLVQLLTAGNEPRVERVALDRQNQGTVTVAGLGQEIDRAVLIISALAPATTEWATYSYEVTQEYRDSAGPERPARSVLKPRTRASIRRSR